MRRVKEPQFERLFAEKYRRGWNKYKRTLPRYGETHVETVVRNIRSNDREDANDRATSSRVYKYTTRLHLVEAKIKANESTGAMQYALKVLEHLGKDGMSSEEEEEDAHRNRVFKVSTMTWRHSDISQICHKIDDLRRQTKDPRGAIAAPRIQTEEPTRRKAVKNLQYEFYDAEWLSSAIGKGFVIAGRSRKIKWKNLETWQASL